MADLTRPKSKGVIKKLAKKTKAIVKLPEKKKFKELSSNKDKKKTKINQIVFENDFIEDVVVRNKETKKDGPECLAKKSEEDLVRIIMQLQIELSESKKRNIELENYVETLLLRVMENTPLLLQNPYVPVQSNSLPTEEELRKFVTKLPEPVFPDRKTHQ